MIWRSLIASFYLALAVIVGVAYGWHGLMVLGFFYFCSGAWLVAFVVWGRTATAWGALPRRIPSQ
ncbi:MAG: hypothetical protein ACRDLK_14035 [Gaiellaceae bacterium]